MDSPQVRFRRLRPDAAVPRYMTEGAAGMDLVAAIDEEHELAVGARAAIGTGLAMALPRGYEAQVRPRSGLALRCGVTVANAPGTIDADYRGELKVILINLGQEPFVVRAGERIAQLVIARVSRCELVEVEDLDDTDRGAGGFGSTGHGSTAK